MEIPASIGLILDRKNPEIWSVEPQATVFDAISLMAEKNIGALPVLQDGKLLGMISERDYTRKVVLRGRLSRETAVTEIMTKKVVTVEPRDSVEHCLQLMTNKHIRHLPVLENDHLAGILSIGDLVNFVISAQSAAIDDLEKFVTGSYPG